MMQVLTEYGFKITKKSYRLFVVNISFRLNIPVLSETNLPFFEMQIFATSSLQQKFLRHIHQTDDQQIY